MDFYHDVVDWVGGFPYECASAAEISGKLEELDFELERSLPALVPTGCDQFVFRRR
jgi:2-polyprenyl-6-hydroxyphenyl methylase/3-demethylubiquinone-9 3-methyltransferase